MNNNQQEHAVMLIDTRDRINLTAIETPKLNSKYTIRMEQGHKEVGYKVRIQDINLPHSFLQVNQFYNTFLFVERDAGNINPLSLSLTLTNGNYTSTEMGTHLKTLINAESAANGYSNTYDISFSDITGKYTFIFTGTSAEVDFSSLSSGSTAVRPLGLGDTTNTLTIATNFDSINHVEQNIETIFLRYINPTTNVFSSRGKKVSTTVDIPIDNFTRGQRVIKQNHDGHFFKINGLSGINTFEFIITDQNENPIDLQGVNWRATLLFVKYIKMNASKPQ